MLTITVPAREFAVEEPDGSITFRYLPEVTLQLEHSLLSVKKWESKWHVHFVGNESLTPEQSLDYIKCMTVSPAKVDPEIYNALTDKEFKMVTDYIKDPHTATKVKETSKPGVRKYGVSLGEILTAEVIYYYMIYFGIPFECQKWHLEQLITLIKVCALKETKQEKKPSAQLAKEYAQLNAARRAARHTKG